MQKGKVLTLGALLMALATLVVCHATPRVPNATRRLAVERFPRQVGVWRADKDVETSPEVQRRIPTARVMERDYSDPRDRHINLLVLNALDDQDFHKPDACLPGQGWSIDQRQTVAIDGRPANAIRTTENGVNYVMYYYWVKIPNRQAPPPGTLLGRLYGLRQLVDHELLSLFVRITAADRPEDRQDLSGFAREVWSDLGPILGDRGEVVLRD